MSEHRIRFRRAWSLERRGPEISANERTPTAERIDLPGALPEESGPLRLVRTFRTPPRRDQDERVELELGKVPGLREVRLDDQAWPITDARALDVGGEEIRLEWTGRLVEGGRHRLELVVDRATATIPDWGEIALVIVAPRA